MMGVYFSALKFESVEQLRGYEPLNFLSKSAELNVMLFDMHSFPPAATVRKYL